MTRDQKTLREQKRGPVDDRFWDDYAEMQEMEQEMLRELDLDEEGPNEDER